MDTSFGFRWENITPAYDKVLKTGIKDLKYAIPQTDFQNSYNKVCDNMCILADRIADYLHGKKQQDEKILWFTSIKERPAEHFEEAIQRMLFLNQIFWQTDHRLVGLGAWDDILFPYYENDIKEGIITCEEALKCLEDLLQILHEKYQYKSSVLMGDTGQIFVLGRSNSKHEYICNELTYLLRLLEMFTNLILNVCFG
ncbi:MAG: hypothetical protein IJ716_09575 [Lachnospiraceae bacterium]|nr:hypothetical protein [Lachnospiraceae bacterium]